MTEQYKTRKQLAEFLQVSERKIIRLEKEGLPRIDIGEKLIRYDLEKVQEWFSNRKGGRSTATSDDFVLPKLKIRRLA